MSECKYDVYVTCDADLTYVECHTCILYKILVEIRRLRVTGTQP